MIPSTLIRPRMDQAQEDIPEIRQACWNKAYTFHAVDGIWVKSLERDEMDYCTRVGACVPV